MIKHIKNYFLKFNCSTLPVTDSVKDRGGFRDARPTQLSLYVLGNKYLSLCMLGLNNPFSPSEAKRDVTNYM